MKKLFLLGFAVIAMTACKQEQRYFADSDEINTLKAGLAAFESGDWDVWKGHFADTAKIYNNSKDAQNISQRLEDLQGMTSAFSSYGFNHEDEYVEMVLDKENETWVYYWAQYNGTMINNKELSVPVHLAVKFAGGKIVEEHIYFDATEMNAGLAELEAAAATEEMPEMEEEGDGD